MKKQVGFVLLAAVLLLALVSLVVMKHLHDVALYKQIMQMKQAANNKKLRKNYLATRVKTTI